MRTLVNRFEKLGENPWFRYGLIVLASAGVIVVPISIGGLHRTGDLAVFLGFGEQLQTAIASGDFFPGWANDNLGFGSVGIRFYPPVAPYVTTLIAMLTKSWYDAIWIFFLGWMIVGCTGIYLFVRELGTRVQAVIAGIFYTIIPFPLAEIYRFNLYAEFAAGAVLPFCFLFVTRICLRRKWIDVLFLGISFSILILTHIPTSLLAAISLFVYVLFIIEPQNVGKILVQLCAAAGLALLMSAFYWINVLTEISWLAHYRDEYSTGLYSFHQWLFPNSIPAKDGPFLTHQRNIDAMIVLTVVLLVPFFALWMSRRDKKGIADRRVLLALSMTGLFVFFMMTRISSFVWSAFPLLQKIQFPWRWLTVLSVTATVSFVLSVSRLSREFPVYRALISFSIAGLIGLMLAFDVRQSFALPNRVSREGLDQLVGKVYLPLGSSSPAWWPVWANAKAFDMADRVVAGGRSVAISRWESKERRFSIGDGPPAEVRVSTFYYPHWRAAVNGNAVGIGKDENGAITIPVEKETSDVVLSFDEPPLTKAALLFSFISWVLCGLILLWYVLSTRRSENRVSSLF